MSELAAEQGAGPAIYGLAQPFNYGRVQLLPLALAQPAATVGFTIPISGAGWRRLVALSVSLVTDAGVVNRQVALDLADADGTVIYRVPPAAVQTASLTIRYSWAIGVPPSAPANVTAQQASLPAVILPPGWQYLLSIVAGQGADRFSALAGLVESFPTGDLGYPVGLTET